MGFIDDTEDPIHEVTPHDNVYSYFMFIGPTEHKKEGSSFTTDTIMAWVLIALNFFMQGVLIYVIFYEVVVDNVEWQEGILSLGKSGGRDNGFSLLSPSPAPGPGAACNTGGSLCFESDGMYSCASPSVQLTGRWSELDVDGDGIWTTEEVLKEREQLKCKYAVDPMEVFDVFQNFLLSRERYLWLHPDVKAGKAIHRHYFDYAAGDIIMCGYRNEDMCANLLRRGFFDGPLANGTSPRIGTTINSALRYCKELLKPGGTCDFTLPSTYSTWKIESVDQCGDAGYSKFVYTHPGTGVRKSLLAVDYSAREDYVKSQGVNFQIFKGIIIFSWLLVMLGELKEITVIVTWVWRFPDAAEFGDDFVKEEPDPLDPSEVKYTIQGITREHRRGVALLIAVRLALTAVLTVVGVSFLCKATDYIGMVKDGIGMFFIVELASVIYAKVLRADVRDQTESLQPMKVNMFGIDYLNRRPALMDMVWLLILFSTVVSIMYWQRVYTIEPVSGALDCTCLSQGDRCFEAQRYNADFWRKYWTQDVPDILAKAEAMRVASGAPSAPTSFYLGHARRAAGLRHAAVAGEQPAGTQRQHWHHERPHRHEAAHHRRHGHVRMLNARRHEG